MLTNAYSPGTATTVKTQKGFVIPASHAPLWLACPPLSAPVHRGRVFCSPQFHLPLDVIEIDPRSVSAPSWAPSAQDTFESHPCCWSPRGSFLFMAE